MPWIIVATTAIFCRIVQFLYYSDVDQIMLKSLLVSVFFEKKNTTEIRRHVSSLSKIQSNNKIKVFITVI
jgi:hypothetical protein